MKGLRVGAWDFCWRCFLPRQLGAERHHLGDQRPGNRRIPSETIKARIFTHPGDIYDPAALERDFNSLWNTGYFEDIRF